YWSWKYSSQDAEQLAADCLRLLGAERGHILDWCGGWGRVSLHFAKKGLKVTILDFMEEYLVRAESIFSKNSLDADLVLCDCRDTPNWIQADYASCTFCSIGFFNDREQVDAFRSLYSALKCGAKFIVDCMNRDFLSSAIRPVNEIRREDGYRFRQNNDFDRDSGVLHSTLEIRDKKGRTEESRDFHQKIYRPDELKTLLVSAGFKLDAMYGDYSGNSVSDDRPQIVAVASKAGH
ncbi:MAG TPA: class I SAM-dependent methyltransferase, partial [Candidatus Goldiibacteriota bacterium]|nr:class I SAM-dependent methyltransferase [Candidatus Goldiibacteriota bacterium]